MSYKDRRVKVLFVCVGNACRSPMAEAIALIDAPDAIEVFSAGLSPIGSVAGMTKQTLKRNGYWVEGLEPKSISKKVWERADIVINLSGRAREQAFREYAKVEDWEIEDPFGKDDINVYQRVFEEIRLHVVELAQGCRQRIAAAQMAERLVEEQLCTVSPAFVNLNGAHEPRNHRGPHRGWVMFAAVGVLIGLVSLTLGWVTTLPDAQTKIAATVTHNEGISSQVVQEQILPPTNGIANDRTPGQAMDTQVHSAEPLLVEESINIPDLPLDDMEQQARPAQHRSAGTVAKTRSRPIKNISGPSLASSVPPRAAATVKSTLVAKVRPLAVGSMSPRSAQPETLISPPVFSTSSAPIDSPPVAVREIKSPMPPPKPPTIPASTTAAVAIVADPYPSLRIPDGGVSQKPRQAASLQLGHLLARVEPVYPDAAKEQGIQGTVKLHAIIGRKGSVENLEPIDGSPVLVAAAMNAVRQWRYTETLLAGRSVETEEDIAIIFRLSNPPIN